MSSSFFFFYNYVDVYKECLEDVVFAWVISAFYGWTCQQYISLLMHSSFSSNMENTNYMYFSITDFWWYKFSWSCWCANAHSVLGFAVFAVGRVGAQLGCGIFSVINRGIAPSEECHLHRLCQPEPTQSIRQSTWGPWRLNAFFYPVEGNSQTPPFIY